MSEAQKPPFIDLSDVRSEVMIAVLRKRGFTVDVDDDDFTSSVFDGREFVEAKARFRRGDVAEALIWLERALPDTFAGLSTAAVPAPSR